MVTAAASKGAGLWGFRKESMMDDVNEWAREHEDELVEFVRLCKQYPGEPILNIWDEVFERQAELSPAEHDAWPSVQRII
jgi:hypothetical protein